MQFSQTKQQTQQSRTPMMHQFAEFITDLQLSFAEHNIENNVLGNLETSSHRLYNRAALNPLFLMLWTASAAHVAEYGAESSGVIVASC